MKQDTFQTTHRAEWDRFARWLDGDGVGGSRTLPASGAPLGAQDFPGAYRRLCQQLALAERRGYSEQLLQELRQLVQRGHVKLYAAPRPRLGRALKFFAQDFPRLVRAQRGALLLAAVLFWVPAIGFTLLLKARPELVYTLCSQEMLDNFREMYSEANNRTDPGDASRMAMFGFYIYHNVSIGFQTIASGLVLCVGAIVVLIANGVLFGAIAGYLDNVGEGPQFWHFVVGHSSLELTAIVISGAGGLRLGMAILAPGRRTRGRALVEQGRETALLALGVFAMLVGAAFIEAYWSSLRDVPAEAKFAVAAVLWSLVLWWLWRGGRDVAADAGPGA